VINKWDGLDDYQKSEVKRKLDIKLSFVNYASVHYISALHGSGVGKLFSYIQKSFNHAGSRFSTSMLNKILESANDTHQPPPVSGKRLRLKYVHQSDVFPPTFILHGNHLQSIPKSYERFLKNFFTKALKISNTPVRLEFKSGENPFKDKKNKLSARQIQKKRRLMKFTKKK
jgi:GTP-binding protein